MKGTGAKRNVCPGSCVSTGAKFPVAPVKSAPMAVSTEIEKFLRRRPFVELIACRLRQHRRMEEALHHRATLTGDANTADPAGPAMGAS